MPHSFFTSESVTEGHPDKICDQISDAILDAVIAADPQGKCCCEVFTTTGLVLIGGEITTSTYVDFQKVARNLLKEIGYTSDEYGIDYKACNIMNVVDEQSPEIAAGEIDNPEHAMGAGDQGIMFGYACRETEELMPLPITLAHGLTKKLAEVRKSQTIPYLRPDGKSQVTVEYDEHHQPIRVEAIVIAAQHDPEPDNETIRQDVIQNVIQPICGQWMDEQTKIFVNETGRFVMGGPQADTGLTGRKIIVDTYGGMGRHGGGCFSGKGPNKQDRSGAYMARWIAKNLVANDLCDRCEVQLSYAIGVAEPISIMIEDFGTARISHEKLEAIVRQNFDMTPKGIIQSLNLNRPIYQQTATYGHFGRPDLDLPWEKVINLEK